MARLRVKLQRTPALWAHRSLVERDKLVYVLVADRLVKYREGWSRIVYIGTTRNGAARIAESVAYRAATVLTQRGIYEFYARTVTCTSRRRVKTWHKLERALLLQFREEYGEVPLCNSHGKKMRWRDELKYFSQPRLSRILDTLR